MTFKPLELARLVDMETPDGVQTEVVTLLTDMLPDFDIPAIERAFNEILALFRGVYGAADAERWFQRWRVFFLACAELFGYRDGSEWQVTHQRLAPIARRNGSA